MNTGYRTYEELVRKMMLGVFSVHTVREVPLRPRHLFEAYRAAVQAMATKARMA